MASFRNALVEFAVVFLLAVMGVLLAAGFRYGLGAPNFGLGIVIAVTTACYIYGLRGAVFCYLLSMLSALYWIFDPPEASALTYYENSARIIALTLTLVVTCGLVLLLRASRESLRSRYQELSILAGELTTTRDQLAKSLHRESRIASNLQRAFLPTLPGRIHNVALAATYEPGSTEAEIGGDFYDIFECGSGLISIAIGDVSGKGLDAARQAVAAKYALRFCASECELPSRCLDSLNRLLIRDPDFEGFVTLFYGVLDLVAMTLTYCTGGHEPPMLLRQDAAKPIFLNPNGRFIGLMSGTDYNDDVIQLESGDILFLFTDGLTEAKGKSGFLYTEGLAEIMAATPAGNVTAMLSRIIDSVRDYTLRGFSDDAAAVLLRIE